MRPEIEMSLYVLILAVPLGLELVRRVSPLLHTPMMSLTNAISAISVVGAIMIAGTGDATRLSQVLGCIAVVASTINIVCGFLVTSRVRSFPTSVVLPSDLTIAGEILTSHIRSIDTQARPIRYAGGGVPPEIAQLVRAKLSTFITI